MICQYTISEMLKNIYNGNMMVNIYTETGLFVTKMQNSHALLKAGQIVQKVRHLLCICLNSVWSPISHMFT